MEGHHAREALTQRARGGVIAQLQDKPQLPRGRLEEPEGVHEGQIVEYLADREEKFPL